MASLSVVFDLISRDNASRGIRDVGEAADDTSRRVAGLSKAGVAVGAAVGGLAAAGLGAGLGAIKNFAAGSVDAFARIEDATGAAGVQFGATLPSIVKFADAAAKNFGISKGAALDAANTFGTMGKAAGLQGPALSGFATQFAGLAGDLASFKGTSTEQAIEAIGSALRGEAEPIRAYGVLLDDASLRQEALAQGLIKTTKEALTPQQKVLAAQALILKQTTAAQGDYARTSDSTANTQKTLSAEIENAQAKLGEKLAPALTAARQGLLGAIQGSSGLIDKLGPLGKTAAGLVAPAFDKTRVAVVAVTGATTAFVRAIPTPVLQVLGGVLAAVTTAIVVQTTATVAARVATAAWSAVTGLFTTVKSAEGVVISRGTVARLAHNVATIAGTVATTAARVATAAYTAAQLALNFALRANPIGLVITAIAALAAGVVIAYQRSDTFRAFVDRLWAALKRFIGFTPLGLLIKNFDDVTGAVKGAWSRAKDFFDVIRSFKLPGWIGTLQDALGSIGGGFKAAGKALGGAFGDGPGIGGSPGDQPRGVKAMMAALPSGTRLISGFRPGAITATGNPSYHGKGRAVDIPPNPALFEYIRSRFGAVAKELIFSPAGNRQIHNGRPKFYGEPTRSNHFDHIHWAMDRGGLARGVGFMPKLTSRPERVLSPAQTKAFERLVDVLDRSRIAGGVVRQGAVSQRSWNALMAAGWEGRADDGLDAIYRPIGDVIKYGEVSDAIWDRLLAKGWTGKANDGMEAIYRPAGDIIKLGQVSSAKWDALKAQGWTGRITDGIEALYKPLRDYMDLAALVKNHATSLPTAARQSPLTPIERAIANAPTMTPKYAPGQVLTPGGRIPMTYGSSDGNIYEGDAAYEAAARDRADLLAATNKTNELLGRMPIKALMAARTGAL